jgi:hypothetical protein
MYLVQILNQIHSVSLIHFCLYFGTDGVFVWAPSSYELFFEKEIQTHLKLW